MKIEEIKAIAPEAEVYSLDPEVKYLIIVKRQGVSPQAAIDLCEGLRKIGVSVAVISYNGNAEDPIHLYKIEEEICQ